MHQLTTSVQLVLAQHCNGTRQGRLFGGQLLAWIDVVGGVAAKRYAHTEVTTACIDDLDFIGPGHLNDMIVQEARVTWTGRTFWESESESPRAFAVYVALDENDKPTPVPPFTPETEEEQADWEAAVKRRNIRLAR